MRKLIFTTSLLLCGVSFLLVLLLVYNYLRDKDQQVQAAKDHARLEAVRATEQIDTKLRKVMSLVQSMADDLSSGTLKDERLVDRLKSTIDVNPELFEIGAAYVPFAYNPTVRLYAPNYMKKDGQPQLIQLETFYDYTEYDWYKNALAYGPVWIEPYFGPASHTLVAGFCAPFYRLEASSQEKIPTGVVRVNFSLEGIRDLVASLDLGKTGYGFILSKKGVYLSHPIDSYASSQKTIFAEARDRNDQALQALGEKATRGESGVIDHANTVTGQSSWIFYEPIPAAIWSLGVVFFKEEIPISNKTLRRQLIRIALGLIAFLLFLSILVFRAYRGSTRGLWGVVLSSSLLFIAGIGFTWYLELTLLDPENNVSLRVTDQATLNEFLADSARLARTSLEVPPVYVPTGVAVEVINFSSATDVTLTGYIWQKYDDGVHDQVSRGVVLPEAQDVQMTEAYRQKEKNVEVIGWRFQIVVGENADDYVKYPLDRGDIRIRLQHQDFAKNVILTPDFDSYQLTDPIARPGLERTLALPGWTIDRSFFGYRNNSYNTNFGIDHSVRQGNFPELYFNIVMRRNFLDPFISYLLPFIMVAFLVFAVLLIGVREGEQFDTLGVSAALLFALVVAQIALRGELTAEKVIYLEYLYFIMYFILLAVAILFSLGEKSRFVQYQRNLIPTLLYWPVVLGLALGITLLIFY